MEDKYRTRWQLRVNRDLKKKVRDYAEKEHRSINQTVIHIIEVYFKILEIHDKENTDFHNNGPDS